MAPLTSSQKQLVTQFVSFTQTDKKTAEKVRRESSSKNSLHCPGDSALGRPHRDGRPPKRKKLQDELFVYWTNACMIIQALRNHNWNVQTAVDGYVALLLPREAAQYR